MAYYPFKGKTKKKAKVMEKGERYGNRGFDRPPREMHKIVCSDCGQEGEVPFKPDGTRPVYCKECFGKHRPPRRY